MPRKPMELAFMKYRLIVVGIAVLLCITLLATGQTKRPPKETVRDPVCGLMVEKDPEMSADHKGRTYYFCSKADRDTFKKNPGKYVK
jgi:YHS domain-containing protein